MSFEIQITSSSTPPIPSVGPFGTIELLLLGQQIGVSYPDEELRDARSSLSQWLAPSRFWADTRTLSLASDKILEIALDVVYGEQVHAPEFGGDDVWSPRVLCPAELDGCLLIGLRGERHITLVGLQGPIPPDDTINPSLVVRHTLSMFEFRDVVNNALRRIDEIDCDPPEA